MCNVDNVWRAYCVVFIEQGGIECMECAERAESVECAEYVECIV